MNQAVSAIKFLYNWKNVYNILEATGIVLQPEEERIKQNFFGIRYRDS